MSLFGHLALGRARRRDALISGFLAGRCTDCPAGPGERCDLSVIAEAVRIDKRPDQLVLHSSRLAAAATDPRTRALIEAQFAGDLPMALRQAAGRPPSVSETSVPGP
jgi:hypothetical protein